ncbi:MAG TPA: tetratricopeptide repeat protein, partial [Candidatus Heimdallarchaeota archaeon]|nr:tetratricopeptide repeat protein [Candidatus Heimdallarchaeota archaeon]
NPRLILSLYTMFAESKILETERDFVRLLDEMTPYFQDRMNALSAQQKKVLDALAMMDGPSTPTEIALFARLSVAIVNSQLNRLKQSRFIAAAKQKGKKQALYDITERLFRFWRQMRVEAGRKRVRFLIKFIEIWYTEEELFSEIEQTFHTLTKSLGIDRMEVCKEAADRLFYIREAGSPIIRAIAHFSRVFFLAGSGDFSTAAAEAEALRAKALAESDDEVLAQALLEISSAEYLQGNIQRATEMLDQFEEVQCDNPAFWFIAGSLYSMVDEREKAASWLKKARKAMPDDPDVNYALGQVLMRVEAYEDATMMLEKAVKTKPDDPQFLLSLALAYRSNDMPAKARESFEQAIALDRGNGPAWLNLGMVLREEGLYEQAIGAFSQAMVLQEEPSEELAYSLNFRGFAHAQNGKNTLAYADAKRAYAIAEKGNWEKALQAAALGILYSGLPLSEWNVVRKKYDRAFEYLREILQYLPPTALQETLSLIGSYVKMLLETKDREIVKRALRVVEESNKPDLLEFLRPYQAALEYLDTGDEGILNRVPSEIRDIVEEIASVLE